jgi:Ca-activated chloride channel family protein
MSTAVDLTPASPSLGARLVTVDGRALPLVAASLAVDARGGIARVVLTQTFRNPFDEPLTVHYSLPLPHEGAVSGFEFVLGQDRVVGEIDRRETARARFDEALAEGRSAALLEQDRGSLFTQEIGNVPPRADLVARVTVDQRLRWRDEGAWEWRFPTVVAPRYLGAPGRVTDAARITQDVADAPLPTRMDLALTVRDALVAAGAPSSPSHALSTSPLGSCTQVRFADSDGARLDRDVVVRWTVAGAEPGVSLDVGHPASQTDAFGLLTVVPPTRATAGAPVPRDLILLLDTSGSMGGAPLDQLRRVSSALIDTLVEGDTLELIEFSNEPRRWKNGAVAVTAQAKHDAHGWIRKLRASGGTEMRAGILEALAGLRDEAQRQVVLMTDGQIGFEAEVVHAIASRLPPGSRVHTVGIGSAVNRSLTGPAARAGRGVEVVIGYDEDPAEAARTLTRRTDAPLRVDLALSGSALLAHAPQALPDLFAASPAQIAVRLRPEGGELVLRARGAEGEWVQRIAVPACAPGEGALHTAALFARERVEDHETELAGGASPVVIDAAIESLGLTFQIATRRTSWVAIRDERTVDPRLPTRRARMPHELPAGLSAEGVGLRAVQPVAHSFGPMPVQAPAPSAAPFLSAAPPSPKPSPQGGRAGAPGASFKMREAEERRESAPAKDAAPPAEAKRKKSLVQSVRDFFLSDQDDARVVADEAEAPAPPPAPPRTVSGRVLRRDGRALTVEFTIPEGGLAWTLDGVVEIVHRDGRAETVTVEVTHSTHAGWVGAGLVLRLGLTLSDEAPRDLISVRLSRPDGSVLIITL